MAAILFDDIPVECDFRPTFDSLRMMRFHAPGTHLDAAYELLARVFDPSVVDLKATYVDALSRDKESTDGNKPIFIAAYFRSGPDEIIAGFLSSDLMRIDGAQDISLLAIGNVATSPRLREIGFRGVGTALWEESIREASRHSTEQGMDLAYSVGEADVTSLGFWENVGYLWPKDLRYLQPPLKFDKSGQPVHIEVPETFLLYPFGRRSRVEVEVDLLCKMILTIYRNWCIEPNRSTLSQESIRLAEEYVMEQVFQRVCTSIPMQTMIELILPSQSLESSHGVQS